jgi:hypothetical protein
MNLKTDKFVNLPGAIENIDRVIQQLEVIAKQLMQKHERIGIVTGFEVSVVGGITESLDAFQGMLKEIYTDELDDDPE